MKVTDAMVEAAARAYSAVFVATGNLWNEARAEGSGMTIPEAIIERAAKAGLMKSYGFYQGEIDHRWKIMTEKNRKEHFDRYLAALKAAGVGELIEALEPFAAVAERDIGSDETDQDIYRPANFNHAPKLTVGAFRRALAALAKAKGETPCG